MLLVGGTENAGATKDIAVFMEVTINVITMATTPVTAAIDWKVVNGLD